MANKVEIFTEKGSTIAKVKVNGQVLLNVERIDMQSWSPNNLYDVEVTLKFSSAEVEWKSKDDIIYSKEEYHLMKYMSFKGKDVTMKRRSPNFFFFQWNKGANCENHYAREHLFKSMDDLIYEYNVAEAIRCYEERQARVKAKGGIVS
jgi:hypothetical protein